MALVAPRPGVPKFLIKFFYGRVKKTIIKQCQGQGLGRWVIMNLARICFNKNYGLPVQVKPNLKKNVLFLTYNYKKKYAASITNLVLQLALHISVSNPTPKIQMCPS